ncbi:MAG: hypothetical protein K0M50_20940 [Prolixibacteraceae bacterium]|nr:hypothetical protein [Prolixibacteraceae bacterium]
MTTDTNKVMISKSSAIIQRASALDALRGYAILTMVLPERLYLALVTMITLFFTRIKWFWRT